MANAPNAGCLPPSQSDRVSAAWQQLHLVLSFPRVDTKLSVVLGINMGLLAMLATYSRCEDNHANRGAWCFLLRAADDRFLAHLVGVLSPHSYVAAPDL